MSCKIPKTPFRCQPPPSPVQNQAAQVPHWASELPLRDDISVTGVKGAREGNVRQETALGGWAHAHRAVGFGGQGGHCNSAVISVLTCKSLFFIVQEAPRKAAQLTVCLHSILSVDSADPRGSILGFQPAGAAGLTNRSHRMESPGRLW